MTQPCRPAVAPASSSGSLDDSALARDSPVLEGSPLASSATGASGPCTLAPGSDHGGSHSDLAFHPQPALECYKVFNLDAVAIKQLGNGCKLGGTTAGSWQSADDSAAEVELEAAGKGSSRQGSDSGLGPAAALGIQAGDGCSHGYEEEEEDWGDYYGANAWRAPWRRQEGFAAGWILLALLAAMVVNLGVGVSNSRRATPRIPQPPPAPAAAAAAAGAGAPAARAGVAVGLAPMLAPLAPLAPPLPPLVPPLAPPPPPPRRRRRPMSPPPPRPHPPPPAFCEVAPPNLARARFSNVTVVFPVKVEHYVANLVEKQGPTRGTRYPAYYNGVVPRFCLVGVEATYTCLQDDNPCNYSPEYALRLCQTACPNNLDSCQGIAGLPGHPLFSRICGLFALSKPMCINIGFTVKKQRMMRAFYKLNLCQAPPGLPPPPRPPLPPAPPPPPPSPPAYEYY